MGAKTVHDISLSSSIESLCSNKITKTCQGLQQAGLNTIYDLLWIFPIRIDEIPSVAPFNKMQDDQPFKGRAKIITIQMKPNFKQRGKSGAMLYNISVYVKDLFSNDTVQIKFFNSYSSVKSKIEKLEYIEFEGKVTKYQGMRQLTNPEITNIEYHKNIHILPEKEASSFRVKYPTINSISGANVKKFIAKIPDGIWRSLNEILPREIIEKNTLIDISSAFMYMHGRNDWSYSKYKEAQKRIIYQEFFTEQIKIYMRRISSKTPVAPKLTCTDKTFDELLKTFPFELTIDQISALRDIRADFESGTPMMRLIQGDVGCGKTAVAIVSSIFAIKSGGQVALMAPTESLALQHYVEICKLGDENDFTCELLLGSTSQKRKKEIQLNLANGNIDFVIGTHSLIQDSVIFKKLTYAIIDEQHKFGVRQRIKLFEKGNGTHGLIMTATPIPRSLSLTQYGDLDVTTIKTMPLGRKGHRTRIVKSENIEQFLIFVANRLALKEQIYIVVPAIEDNDESDLVALESTTKKFKQYFPDKVVTSMHGRLKTDEKQDVFLKFKSHEIDILVATSVVEVGINVVNATVMAVMSPERFGLSSLHQLRGRVGRGDKLGYCFLVNEKQISNDSMHRLKVIENHTDGFVIAEEDLKIRGEGDLFGTGQSGVGSERKLANIVLHADILNMVKDDFDFLLTNNLPYIEKSINLLENDSLIHTTL